MQTLVIVDFQDTHSSLHSARLLYHNAYTGSQHTQTAEHQQQAVLCTDAAMAQRPPQGVMLLAQQGPVSKGMRDCAGSLQPNQAR
jgi:hypothetical protein